MAHSHHKESFYARGIARIYDSFMRNREATVLGPRRAYLLRPLRGKVLEIGAGTGVNFQYYHPETSVLAIEPSLAMLEKARQKATENIRLLHAGLGDPEFEQQLEAGSLDAIVCTLVLCTVPDPQAAFVQFVHWLKPGGRLILLEHIVSHHPFKARLQSLFTPFWKMMAEGCHLNRPTDKWIAETHLQKVEEEYFQMGVSWYQAVYLKKRK